MSQTYGYIRVSTRDQNEDRQLVALSPSPLIPYQRKTCFSISRAVRTLNVRLINGC